jgi:hypothetical protein
MKLSDPSENKWKEKEKKRRITATERKKGNRTHPQS